MSRDDAGAPTARSADAPKKSLDEADLVVARKVQKGTFGLVGARVAGPLAATDPNGAKRASGGSDPDA